MLFITNLCFQDYCVRQRGLTINVAPSRVDFQTTNMFVMVVVYLRLLHGYCYGIVDKHVWVVSWWRRAQDTSSVCLCLAPTAARVACIECKSLNCLILSPRVLQNPSTPSFLFGAELRIVAWLVLLASWWTSIEFIFCVSFTHRLFHISLFESLYNVTRIDLMSQNVYNCLY